ncbi:hypothetical protein CLPUN_05070 [Clostridium puniceum]|uniref:Uncharacterized protein n=1 Tax=Clostridium puniceum TaxID=29367 RepID=A0A1S8TWM6_9CLOT|nr:hypothetical protein [Clostridium puniceum]OOM82128.1 hypothetical protein CLPUN_05070 [Clostridium puniceum]
MNINNYGKVEDYETYGSLDSIEDSIKLLKIDTEITEEDEKRLIEEHEPYQNKNIRITWAIKEDYDDSFTGVILVDKNDNVIYRIGY